MAQHKKTPCLQYSMHYLSSYPKTKKELRIKLLEKWYLEDEIDKTIAYLEKNNYVNDEEFVRAYINSEIVRKGKPIILIKQKLYQKGVDQNIIEHVLRELGDDVAEWVSSKIIKEVDKCKALWIEGFDIIQKLLKKGYTIGQIKKTIQERDSAK